MNRNTNCSIAAIFIMLLSSFLNMNYSILSADSDTDTLFGLQGYAVMGTDVTGGAGGETVTASDYSNLASYVQSSDPLIIQVFGTINGSGMLSINGDKTIIGIGDESVINGFGFHIDEVTNVIVRNISFTNASDDGINIQGSEHIWVDHCNFSHAYDGCLDIKRAANLITVSWNKFSNHNKTCLLGHDNNNGDQDIGKLKVTYHHNWFNGTEQRHPRVRFGEVHVFNNFYDSIGLYGIASVCEAQVLVESNYFLNTEYPAVTGGLGIESPPGYIHNVNNYFNNSGTPEEVGTVFDPSTYYYYRVDEASKIDSIVSNNAGVGILYDPTDFIILTGPLTSINNFSYQEKTYPRVGVYPNPVKDYSYITFLLQKNSNIRLSLYNTMGQRIRVLADNYYGKGKNSIPFQKEELSPGVYFLRFESDQYKESVRIIVQ